MEAWAEMHVGTERHEQMHTFDRCPSLTGAASLIVFLYMSVSACLHRVRACVRAHVKPCLYVVCVRACVIV